MRRPEPALVALFASVWLAPATALADEAPGDAGFVVRDPVLAKLQILDQSSADDDPAPLWDRVYPPLQAAVEAALVRLGLDDDVRDRDLSVVLVDITEIDEPKVAAVNGDLMLYAASLPKIAVLLAVFDRIAAGDLVLDAETQGLLENMVRDSSNSASTEMMHRVGKEKIADVLLSPRYRLYDPRHNGGLWVGKDYARAGLWRRDPLHNLSHGATAMQVARFYYLLETGNLVSPEHSRKMKAILADTHLNHKFMATLNHINPDAQVLRKSGSWRTFHSDSVLVRRGDRGYIAVALSDDPEGSRWLAEIIWELNELIFPSSS
jgi:beta-lactamase class A